MKVKHYFDRCYMQNFWLFIDWPEEKFIKYIKKTFGITQPRDGLHDGKTMIFTNDDGREIIIVWTASRLKGINRTKVIAHECLHAVGAMYSRVGVKYDPENDEPFTYMQGVLIEESLK